jgi:hypothetical protein
MERFESSLETHVAEGPLQMKYLRRSQIMAGKNIVPASEIWQIFDLDAHPVTNVGGHRPSCRIVLASELAEMPTRQDKQPSVHQERRVLCVQHGSQPTIQQGRRFICVECWDA